MLYTSVPGWFSLDTCSFVGAGEKRKETNQENKEHKQIKKIKHVNKAKQERKHYSYS